MFSISDCSSLPPLQCCSAVRHPGRCNIYLILQPVVKSFRAPLYLGTRGIWSFHQGLQGLPCCCWKMSCSFTHWRALQQSVILRFYVLAKYRLIQDIKSVHGMRKLGLSQAKIIDPKISGGWRAQKFYVLESLTSVLSSVSWSNRITHSSSTFADFSSPVSFRQMYFTLCIVCVTFIVASGELR